MRKQRDWIFSKNKSRVGEAKSQNSPFHSLLFCYNSLLITVIFLAVYVFTVKGHVANTKQAEEYKKYMELASKKNSDSNREKNNLFNNIHIHSQLY